MKASLLSLLLLGSLRSGAALAQTTLSNGTLESWATETNVEYPVQWITSDRLAAELLVVLGGVTKSTESHAGQFAARLSFKSLPIPFVGTFPIPAVLLLGTKVPVINPQNLPRTQDAIIRLRPGGIPFTARPTALQFWYKYTGQPTDAGQAAVILSLRGQLVGQAVTTLNGGVTNYTLMNMPINYSSAEMPDTVRVFFIAGTNEVPSATASLFIDDVTLPLTVTASRNARLDAALTVYPNPSAAGEFALASLEKPGLATAPLTVTDATGRVVLRQGAAPVSAANGRRVSLQGQPAGVYMLRLRTAEGTLTRKLVVQ